MSDAQSGAQTETVRPSAIARDGTAFVARLPLFDGPLDLLLHLIRKEELDIFDIEISRLTSAYLEAIAQMLELEPASDFLVMAATLIELKSRLLLPRQEPMDEAGEDPRAALSRQLLEYARFKEVALALGTRSQLGRDVFVRPDGLDRPPAPAEGEGELANQDVYRLAEAFRRLVDKSRFEAPHDIYIERVTIAERIAEIADRLAQCQTASLAALCGELRYRETLITTFLACLEMVRLKLIRLDQPEPFGEVLFSARVAGIGQMGEEAAGLLD